MLQEVATGVAWLQRERSPPPTIPQAMMQTAAAHTLTCHSTDYTLSRMHTSVPLQWIACNGMHHDAIPGLPLPPLEAVAARQPSVTHEHREGHAWRQAQQCDGTLLEDERNHPVLHALTVLVPVFSILCPAPCVVAVDAVHE